MSTILIGFTRKVGTFTSDKTGEVVAYSNRDLRFITDSNPDSKHSSDIEVFSPLIQVA